MASSGVKESQDGPYVVAGMHRCGTGAVSRIMETLGVFMGKRRDRNDEAFCFRRANEWVLRQTGGSWDYPMPIVRLLADHQRSEEVSTLLGQFVEERHFREYRSYVAKKGSGFKPWGWKDPRNTFTLPLWRKKFPDAKLIFVVRNPVDVVASLVRRARSVAVKDRRVLRRQRLRDIGYAFFRQVPGYSNESIRCLDPVEAFGVWRDYVSVGLGLYERYEGDKVLISYEELLDDSRRTVRRLAEKLSLPCSTEVIESAASLVKNPTGNGQYLLDNELDALVSIARRDETVRRAGYEV
ncbi:MAG: sulfotransferase [Deltaproteobacteria bacterium]|nr:sulfotransferase [Deltaproteobacteria bacterium]